MAPRRSKNCVFETLVYESGGILLVTSLCVHLVGSFGGNAFLVIASLSLATLLWYPVHNAAFDWLCQTLAGRLASDRRQTWGLTRAISHDITLCLLACPVLIWLTALDWVTAILVMLVMPLTHAVYSGAVSLLISRFRPALRHHWLDVAFAPSPTRA